jgi:hypothetical protein
MKDDKAKAVLFSLIKNLCREYGKKETMRLSGLGYKAITTIVEDRPDKRGRKRKWDQETENVVKEFIQKNPDAYLQEAAWEVKIRTKTQLSKSTISRIFKSISMVRKAVSPISVEKFGPHSLAKRLRYFCEICH